MNKIRTVLPYPAEDMHEIYNNGAVVDVSRMNFPRTTNLEKAVRQTILFLRNTTLNGFKNIEFDYTEMSYEQKEELLKQYLTTDLDLMTLPQAVLRELASTWVYLLYYYVGVEDTPVACILNDLEKECFMQNNQEFVITVAEVMSGVPIYFISQIGQGLPTISEEISDEPFGINFWTLLTVPELDGFFNIPFTKTVIYRNFYEKNFDVLSVNEGREHTDRDLRGSKSIIMRMLQQFSFAHLALGLINFSLEEIEGLVEQDDT